MTKRELILLLLIIASSILIGFFIGKSNTKIETKTEIKYQTGPSIGNILTDFKPISIDIPKLPYLLMWRDTIWLDSVRYEVQPVDSLKILKDWLSKRYYDLTLFDIDTIGKCNIKAETQYNQLKLLEYKFTPVNKVTNITNTIIPPKFELFGGVGLNTGNYYNAQIGFYKNNLGIGYQYTRNFSNKEDFHGINAFYKFKLK